MKKILLITSSFLLINPSLSYGSDDLLNDIMKTRQELGTAIRLLDKLGREVETIREVLNRTDIGDIGSALQNESTQRRALEESQRALQECQQQLNQQN